MAKKANARSPSPARAQDQAQPKRAKLAAPAPALAAAECFAPGVLAPGTAQALAAAYARSAPYKHAVLDALFDDALLERAKDECLAQLAFALKETDIYRVHQTGDLASLDYLAPEQAALLPSVRALRDALYSPEFRAFVRAVTGCGPLSGTKQDMSVNTYRRGCHLLNHDDVIGSRRVSYILYMPLPARAAWAPAWGGALELYPVVEKGGALEPEAAPSKTIPPSWNQFIFFEVQPGHSFHSVEEVVVDEAEDGRQRLSISGWFHVAQEGEEGYEPETQPALQSSREQLAASSTVFSSYAPTDLPPLPDTPLSEAHTSFLSSFLNPVYLQKRTMAALAQRFVLESQLELQDFLSAPIADKLRAGLRARDAADGLGPGRPAPIPPHAAGAGNGWAIKGPPHKWRYAVLAPGAGAGAPAELDLDAQMRSLQDGLMASDAFRAWLACVVQVLPLRHAVEARRFRPGLDYTLATSEDNEARLDVVLGLTPQVEKEAETKAKGKGKGKQEDQEEEETGWESGEWGGWECYMAPHGEEDDPAVYRSGGSKKAHANGDANGASAGDEQAGAGAGNGEDADMDGEGEEDEEEEDEGDGTLLVSQPHFNSLQLVLRDSGLMHFVKYVSAQAQGSRWDVCGEYEIGTVEADDDEAEDEDDA